MINARLLLAGGLCSVAMPLALLGLSASPYRQADRPLVWPSGPSNVPSTAFESPRSIETGPDAPEVIDGSTLYGVTCISASDCWAVGFYGNDVDQTLIEHWDGALWTIVPSPNIPGYNELFAVACPSAADCWAVGQSNLVEHWNGVAWSIFPMPAAVGATFHGITCASATDCWAVGQYYNPYPRMTTLIEHWNGTSWTIVNSPNLSSTFDRLLSVTCVSPSDCWAVGNGSQALIEHWDGVSWSVANVQAYGYLWGVRCVSGSQCWAVGNAGFRSLIEKWDGNSWTVASSPNGNRDFLEAVACPSASDCWAVGSNGYPAAPINRWNGTSWVTVPSPSVDPSPQAALHGVSCISPSDCWAVGDQLGTQYNNTTLIEHWDGQAWSITPTPPSFAGAVSRMIHGDAGTFDVALPGIDCRNGDASGNYQLVFSFLNNLVGVGSAATTDGIVESSWIGPSPNQYTVNLSGIPSAKFVTVTLTTVHDTAGDTGNVSTRIGVLVGDSNGDGHVNASDVAQTRSRVGQPVTSGTFASDVNATGTVNATDVAIVKSGIGSALP